MAGVAGGCSAPKAAGEGAEPGKERLHNKEMLLGVKRRENITLKEGVRMLAPEPACNTHGDSPELRGYRTPTHLFLHFLLSECRPGLTHGPRLPGASGVRPCQYSPCPEVTSTTALYAQAQMMQSVPEINHTSQVPQTQHPALVETCDLIPSTPQLTGTARILPEPSVPSGSM